ncbi:hypothetical protein NXC24_CH01028 [Rhizobium sp. NXC24]|nr:hypothetical protein NXC24_CH01028 [Rhizobium sp. NXC24]
MPPFESLSFVASICLTRLSRGTRRDLAGYDIGKRRNLAPVPHIALDMAKELLRVVQICNGDQPVPAAEIAAKIEAILRGIPDEEAFHLASISTEEREAVKDQISEQIRDAILAAYTVMAIERAPEPAKAIETNGWKGHESITADEKPRYKWRHTWAGKKGDDFVGYKDGTCVGRIFRLDYTQQCEKWFWLVEHVPLERLERQCPSGGWEWGAREAACRVEKCYDAIMRLNGKGV